MAKIETLSLEVDGILPDTRVFRERCFLLDGAALYSFKAAPALVPQGRINLHVRRLPFRTSEGVTLGDGAASVVLPTALLQARLTGADGASAVVQAGSPFVRDLIVSTARKFAM